MKQSEAQKQALIQCPECRTHVKMNDQKVCPFCETSLALVAGDGTMQGIRRSLSKRSSFLVASLFGLSTLGGIGMQACDGNKTPTEKTASENAGKDGGTTDTGKTTPDTSTTPDAGGGNDEGKADTGNQPDTPVLPPYGIPPDTD